MGIFRSTGANLTQVIDTQQISSGCCAGGECSKLSDENIREIAYFRWLAATGGAPVSNEESQRFWFEAEQEAKNQ